MWKEMPSASHLLYSGCSDLQGKRELSGRSSRVECVAFQGSRIFSSIDLSACSILEKN